MNRRIARSLVAAAVALSALGIGALPVFAECPYVPDWPPITGAIPSAREIVVGEIVSDFSQAELDLGSDQAPRDYALRITEVLRGDARPGDLVDVQYLFPNWPWTLFTGSDEPVPSCNSFHAVPGEVLALAFDALFPGGRLEDQATAREWYQPPTRYHATGVIKAVTTTDGLTWTDREMVTLDQLRALAALPRTDAGTPALAGPASAAASSGIVLLIGMAATVVGLMWLRSRGQGRRGSPGR